MKTAFDSIPQSIRFVVIGGINTVFGYAVFAGLILAQLEIAIALLISTILGVFFNFVTTGHFVFGSRDPARLFRFIVLYAVLYGLNVGALKLILAQGIGPLIGQLMALPTLVLLSFFLNKNWVFHSTEKGSSS